MPKIHKTSHSINHYPTFREQRKKHLNDQQLIDKPENISLIKLNQSKLK